MIVKLLTEHHLEFLSLKGGSRGSSESTLVRMSHCWKSHATAQIVFFRMNRDAKQNLEMDWSDKKEAHEIDTASGNLKNHHTNKQFYPGAAKFQEM